MVIQQVLRSFLARRKKVNDKVKMQNMTVGEAITMHMVVGRRVLLNDGEVLGIEESFF